MKKIILLTIILAGFSVKGQQINEVNLSSIDSKFLEITITKRLLSDKVNVQLDTGQDTHFFTFRPRANYYIVHGPESTSSKFNKIEFNSTVSVLNYFDELGYEVNILNGSSRFSKSPAPIISFLQFFITPFRNYTRGERFLLEKK